MYDHQAATNEAFQFRGAAAVALATIKRIAETGRAFDWQPEMDAQARLTVIAADCERLLALLPESLLKQAAEWSNGK